LKPPDNAKGVAPKNHAPRKTLAREFDDLGSVKVGELEPIGIDESADFIRLEKVIERGLDTFVEVGNALAEIRDRRLYRCEHKTFEDYCRDKWNIGRTYAHRLMAAAETVEMLPVGNKPTSERQVRALAKLPAEKRPEAWQRAIERADGRQPTALEVEAVVEEVATPPAGRPVVKIDAAERIWAVAKGHLDKIIDEDVSVIRVMDAVAAYCEGRKAALTAGKVKLSGRQSRRLTFTIDGQLIGAEAWNHGDAWQPPTITITAHSKAELCHQLKAISATSLSSKVWKAAAGAS